MKLIKAIKKPIDFLFYFSSFLNLALVFFVILGVFASAIKSNVVFSFPFDFPFLGYKLTVGGLIDLQSIVFSSIFLFSGAYSVINNNNVRVDIIYKNLSLKYKLFIDILGTLFLSIPFVCFIFYYSIHFVQRSYFQNEVSLNGGISSFYVFKAAIPISFFFLLLSLVLYLCLKCCELYKIIYKGGDRGL